MKKILVSGLINIETTLQIESFPIEYFPVRYPFFGINSTVSGVGYNVTKALENLGNEINFLSIIGKDLAGKMVLQTLKKEDISGDYILESVKETAHSVILYDKKGKRQINVDLKNIQEKIYPEKIFEKALNDCNIAALCNINFSRPLLKKALEKGKLIATDVHAISDLNDDYNKDFMTSAHILFMSDELLPCHPLEWIKKTSDRYGTEIIVIGLGEEGALLSVKKDNSINHFPALYTRPVVNTIGAGDALFSSFIHFYNKNNNPYEAIKKAILFASYKIGEKGAAEGFLEEETLDRLYVKKYGF